MKKKKVLPQVALVGRPNVGKSTLFNRLIGQRMAIVHDRPGVTRDVQIADCTITSVPFQVMDCAGLERSSDKNSLEAKVYAHNLRLIEQAALILFVVDGIAGFMDEDRALLNTVRKLGKPIWVVVNKCDKREAAAEEFFALGARDVFEVSAEHNLGIPDLLIALDTFLGQGAAAQEDDADADITGEKPIRVAVLGRPNVGKSTFVNQLLQEERLLVADMPGVTRDAIEIPWTYAGRDFVLIDTAGLRRKSRITDSVERLSTKDSLDALQYADVAILVVDATQAFEQQDLRIAQRVIEEGRILVLAINKWDKVDHNQAALDKMENFLRHTMPDVPDVPYIPVIATTGYNMKQVMRAVTDLYAAWNKRITTAQLNRCLQEVLRMKSPPIVKGRAIQLKYLTQIKSRPPTFVLFCTKAAELPDSYQRFVINNIRRAFDLDGVPIRLYLRQSKNPYV